jgi:alginate O-acetyltransferase complex protein AlgI
VIGNLFSIALWLATLGHLSLLAVSVQVPVRLHWREELARISPFNRKLLWVYGGFVVFTYLSFAALTAFLHDELLAGDKAALGLAAFIGVYWSARLVVEFTIFDSRDWPPGRLIAVGHALLNCLFVFFAVTYLGLVVWRLA